jgi:hypothetical protein
MKTSLLSTAAAAKLLGISERRCRELCQPANGNKPAGVLHGVSVLVGHRYLIDSRRLGLARRRNKTAGPKPKKLP